MLSISSAKHAGGAISYFSDHLVSDGAVNATEDYYAGHGEPGQWIGAGALALGLNGEVQAEDFARILLAVDNDGRSMVSNGGDPDRRSGWDSTFSAPKSVSTLWASGDAQLRDAIAQAQSHAVDKAMSYLEGDGGISGRRGKGGLELEASKMIASKFNHGTSREQDPQLHTHVFTMNLAQRADGSWGAIQSFEIMKRKMATGAIYRAELANQMQKLGFNIEQRPKGLFEVIGVSEALQKQWSKRRGQVVEAMNEHGGKSAKSAEAAALSTRSKKADVNQGDLVKRWQEEAVEYGVTAASIKQLQQQAQTEITMQSTDEIWLELTQQSSTLSSYQLASKIFEKAAGALSADQAQAFLKEIQSSDQTITLRDAGGNRRYTSREMYALEQAIVSSAVERQNEGHALDKSTVESALAKSPTISDEQRNMIKHITGNEGVVVVEGMAGTGKSFALNVANDAWLGAGYNVIGAALSGKAAEGLQEGAAIKSQTLHSLLFELNRDPLTNEPPKRRLTNKDVLIIDEAGMVGSRQMSQLLEKAGEAGAKVVLVGDSKQLQPIDAGGSFRGLSRTLGAAELVDIRRQRQDWARQAVTDFASGDAAKALGAFKERGLLVSAKTHQEIIEKMVGKWLDDAVKQNNGDLRSSLMLAGTRADVAYLNQAARTELKETLSGDPVHINNADFQINDRTLFTKNNKTLGVKNGSLATVIYTDIESNTITVRLDGDNQKLVVIDPADYEDVQHGYAVTTHKAQGVTVDRAYILTNEFMSSREWSYVAASRARDDTTIFATESLMSELEQTMSESQAKDLTTDYVVVPNNTATPYHELE